MVNTPSLTLRWNCILNCRWSTKRNWSLYKLSQYEKWCWNERNASDTAAQSTGLGVQHARPLAQTSYLCWAANQTTCRLFITVVLFRSRGCNCFDKISRRFLLFERGLMVWRAVVDLELKVLNFCNVNCFSLLLEKIFALLLHFSPSIIKKGWY